MADDDYVEGDSNSAPADAPGAVPADDAPKPAIAETIDSVSVQDAPIQRMKRGTASAARKAFAEAILANKAKPTIVNEDQEDPEDVALAAAEADKVKPAAEASSAASSPGEATAPPPAPIPEPPAPSLHPEVLQLKQQLGALRGELEKERAALAKKAEPAPLPDVGSLEDYIDSQPKWFRGALEKMRGETFASDDEFKAEVRDFITSMSTDVLGVPLPENVRAQFDAAQAKKIVRTHKTIQQKQQAAAQAKADRERAEADAKAQTEQVEREWSQAATVLRQQFAPQPDATGKHAPSAAATSYPWLAAEDDPGKIIVDVIRAAVTKDGTQLSWQEASKKANDYLEAQAKGYYEKRKPLLAAAPAAKPATPAAKPATPATPPPAEVPEARAAAEPKKWSRDRHLESSKAAFRHALGGKTT